MSNRVVAGGIWRKLGLGVSVFALVSPAILVFLWMISLSLKNELDNTAYPPVFIPNPPTFSNYIDVFEKNSHHLHRHSSNHNPHAPGLAVSSLSASHPHHQTT